MAKIVGRRLWTVKMRLTAYGHNVYSQFGEDGILSKVFDILKIRKGVCVEFGAWDGFHFSNTAALWTQGWQGVLIEADEKKYRQLCDNIKSFNCQALHAYVTANGEFSLEEILRRHQITGPIDFLSIDIDGDDYYIFESLRNLHPTVVCCEYNPTIPAHMELIPQPGNYFGCSALSLVNLARSKGYRLVAVTDTNCVFVDEKQFDRFHEYETDLETIAVSKYVTYLMSGYDGKFVLSQKPIYGISVPSALSFSGHHFKIPVNSLRVWIAIRSRKLARRFDIILRQFRNW